MKFRLVKSIEHLLGKERKSKCIVMLLLLALLCCPFIYDYYLMILLILRYSVIVVVVFYLNLNLSTALLSEMLSALQGHANGSISMP